MSTLMYTIRQIAGITGGQLRQEAPGRPVVEHLLLDSRRIFFAETSLFFAIKGERHDGHDYLPELYRAGVRHFLISRKVNPLDYPEASLLLHEDPVAALQELAAYHRRRFALPVIGITGSNGKTIVKEWLFQLLHDDYYLVRSPGSYNSQVGVPLSVWQINPAHELGIFEAGISRRGEMAQLSSIIDCNIGLFTNIGAAHSEGFRSRGEKLREKLQLFRQADIVFYCADQEEVDEAIRALNRPRFTWSRWRPADLYISRTRQADGQTEIRGEYLEEQLEVRIPFTDAASVENAIHCWALALYLGIDPGLIAERMSHLAPVAMRLELKEGINGSIVINDSYNSDLSSLSNALSFLEQQGRSERRTLILSDILQSGMDDEELYRRVGLLIREKQLRRVIGIGLRTPLLASFLPPAVEKAFFATTDDFLNAVDKFEFHREVILLKGARPFAFERIARRLAQQVHQTSLEIKLDALVHNLNVYRRQLRPGVQLMAMVKASAYGGGGLEIAKLLEFQRVAYLAVAYADEGVELRQGGVQLPVVVLNAEPATFEALLRFGLEPEIYSLRQLQQFASFAAGRPKLPAIHLKIDTGMRRLGFEEREQEAMLELLQGAAQLRVQSVFSHLAASEAPEHDDFTREQVRQFERRYEVIAEALGYRPLRHILNSSGIARFPGFQLDMVRLGIGMYGSDASGVFRELLQPVFHFKAHISQIKELAPGETVGYGRRALAGHHRRIATITAGYADGLPRAAGNGRYSVLIRDRRAPIVGSVCMDMCMVDITSLPEAQEGDEVSIFGDAPGVEELAEALQTIPYEVLTGISRRVKRVYTQD